MTYDEYSKKLDMEKGVNMLSETKKKILYAAHNEKALPENAHRNARMRKAWKSRIKEIITEETECAHCRLKNPDAVLQIHHQSRDAYKKENFHLYERLSPELPFLVLCKKCHWAAHHGMTICKECGKNYHPEQYERCFKCSGKESTDIYKAVGYDHSSSDKSFRI